MRIAYLTAGAGGMICGSCLHDNTLARALKALGCDAQLIPTYTPIRTDEQDVSIDRVFFGGINVYLEQKFSLFRRLPPGWDGWLSSPGLLRWATEGRIETNAALLGDLTVSMLRGEQGYQRKEIDRLVDYLAGVRPDVVNLSNVLIGGCAAAIKRRIGATVLTTLQGDDLFLADLPPTYRNEAIELIGRVAEHVDGFLVFSDYYADFMAEYLRLPRDRFHRVPLGIDIEGFAAPAAPSPITRPPTVGYLARHCPAKGFHVLVEAFLDLRTMAGFEHARLHTAGWLGESDRKYFDGQLELLRRQGADEAFQCFGIVDRRQKIEFLHGIDALSVPTTYREPKGLFVLEALAAGVPVVQPEHGAFPELLAASGGGVLVPPNNSKQLALALAELLGHPMRRERLGREGQANVLERFNAAAMARGTLDVYRRLHAQARR